MRIRVGLQYLAIVASSLFVVACQSTPQSASSRYNNGAFKDLWSTYTHCLAADQLQAASIDSMKLHRVSVNASDQTSFQALVPTTLRKNLTQPSPRLAVDLHAMAASCGLHTGSLAAAIGEFEIARSQFRQVLTSDAQGQDSYYADQARTRLADLELALQASAR